MKRFSSFLFVTIAATTLVISVAAQTSMSLWPYYVEVTPQNSEAAIYDVIVPLAVMDKARADLADLRLFDSANREIPYAILIRKDVNVKREIPTRLFNSSQAGPANSEVSVDLGESPGEHNEIEIATDGSNFRRLVEIQGSNSGSDWRTLTSEGVLFSFTSQNSVAESKRITYPPSRYRYLRVRVQRDQLTDEKAPNISSVKVMMAVHEQGLLSSWEVPVPDYQLLRNQGAHASVWTIDLGGRGACDRLILEVDDSSFSRPFQVEAIDDPQNPTLLATGELTRHVGDAHKPLEIVFNQEENVRKLRLQITDYSNPTLTISAITASAPARQLVYELKEPPSQSLRLFFGNPNASAPHYDFEKELFSRGRAQPLTSTVGDLLENREYKPEPLPFTERAPWLIYLVLAASSIALAFILWSLARTATRLNPQSPN